MKKYVVVILLFLLVITGCGKQGLPKQIGNQDGLVLVYEDSNISLKNSPTYKISLYNDKRIISEYSEQGNSYIINLSEEDYQKILETAFSEKFLDLAKNITSMETEGGSTYSVTLYYNGKTFTTGGQNIEEKEFIKLQELLVDMVKEEEEKMNSKGDNEKNEGIVS